MKGRFQWGETSPKRTSERWPPTAPRILLSVGTDTPPLCGEHSTHLWCWVWPELRWGACHVQHVSLIGFTAMATQDPQFLPEEWPPNSRQWGQHPFRIYTKVEPRANGDFLSARNFRVRAHEELRSSGKEDEDAPIKGSRLGCFWSLP